MDVTSTSWTARLGQWIVSQDERYKNELLTCVALLLQPLVFGLLTITNLYDRYTNWAVWGPLLIACWLLVAGVLAFHILRWRRKTRAGTLRRRVWKTFGIGLATVAVVLAALSAFTFLPERPDPIPSCMEHCPPEAERSAPQARTSLNQNGR